MTEQPEDASFSPAQWLTTHPVTNKETLRLMLAAIEEWQGVSLSPAGGGSRRITPEISTLLTQTLERAKRDEVPPLTALRSELIAAGPQVAHRPSAGLDSDALFQALGEGAGALISALEAQIDHLIREERAVISSALDEHRRAWADQTSRALQRGAAEYDRSLERATTLYEVQLTALTTRLETSARDTAGAGTTVKALADEVRAAQGRLNHFVESLNEMRELNSTARNMLTSLNAQSDLREQRAKHLAADAKALLLQTNQMQRRVPLIALMGVTAGFGLSSMLELIWPKWFDVQERLLLLTGILCVSALAYIGHKLRHIFRPW